MLRAIARHPVLRMIAMRIPPLRRRITEKDVEEIFRVVGRFREVEYRKEVGEMLRDAEPPRKISEMVRR